MFSPIMNQRAPKYNNFNNPYVGLLARQEQQEHNDKLRTSIRNFCKNITQERVSMDKYIKRGEYLKEVMNDPTKAENIEEDIIDENLNMLLISNEDHANYEISFKKREL